MIEDKEFISKLWPQNCGDTLKIIEKSDVKKRGTFLWKCLFTKYPYEILENKDHIIRGKVINPQIEIEEFVNKLWPQNCGDTLKVIKKSQKKRGDKYLWECAFLKYPCKIETTKDVIIKGSVLNPQIEKKEFIGQEYLQKCNDVLKVLEKSDKKNSEGKFLYKCKFQNYPYTLYALKANILKGNINNPQIEKCEFIHKWHKQNCGDTLKIIKKSEIKDKNGSFLWECEFLKYPYKINASKESIIKGNVINPLIEKEEFASKTWDQFGDSIKVLNKVIKNGHSYWECNFIKYPNKTSLLFTKSEIINGKCFNPNLPWRSKENLQKYLEEYKNKVQKDKFTLSELSQELNIARQTIGQAINKFGLRNYIDYTLSGLEKELFSFCESLGIQCTNSQNFNSQEESKEIDIYFPSYKIGLEFNGNYWHSELYKEASYHQKKTLFFQKQQISLFHIFEYEWIDNQSKIKQYIKGKLGIFDQKIFARKCTIKEISDKEYRLFCQKYHLQNEAGARVKLGLYYLGELVQIMSFGCPRFSNEFEWEIIRECSKANFCIVGGKEKLWNYFVKKYNPKSCLSYCDFSKFKGDSYLKIGFEFLRLNKPGFVWWDKDSNLTFWRNPKEHSSLKDKYLKIYDAGQLVFGWNSKSPS